MLSAILKRTRRPDVSTNAAANHIAEDRFRALEAAQIALKPFVPHFGRLIVVKAAMGFFYMALQELGNNFRGIGTIHPVKFFHKTNRLNNFAPGHIQMWQILPPCALFLPMPIWPSFTPIASTRPRP